MRDKTEGKRETIPRKRGITLKILILILAITVISFLSFLLIAQYTLTHSIRDSLGIHLRETASGTASLVDTIISGQIEDIRIITNTPSVLSALVNVNSRYSSKSTLSREQEEASQKWLQAQGTEVIDSDLATNSTARYLKSYIQIKDEEGETASLFITDKKGALVSTINERPKYFHGDDQWWGGTYNGRKAYISDIYYDDSIKEYLLDIVLPIMDAGETLGIIKKSLVVSRFFGRSMPRLKIGETAHAMLVDSRGKVIFCPLLDTGSSLSNRSLISSFVSPAPAWASVADDAHGGKNSLIGSAPLEMTSLSLGEGSSDINWYAFTWQDPGESMVPGQRPFKRLLMYGLIAAGVILIIGYIGARRITSPIKGLIEGTEIIGEGGLDHHLDIDTGDEVGELARRFNQVLTRLRDEVASVKELERRLLDNAGEIREKDSELAKYSLMNTEKTISIERFAEGIAHEINNHLGIIFGFIQVMLKECDHGCPSYEEIKIIEKHVNYTKNIIDELLDFARISNLEKEEVDINKNIEETFLPIEGDLSAKNISFVFDLAPNLPKIYCDPKKLQQVYMNLLVNQTHSMREGDIFTVSTAYDREKNSIGIRFKDTGTGIHCSDVNRIFDPFYVSKGREAGIGLSLSASYGIIKEHQGEISVESKEGEGTMFIISIPVNQSSQASPSESSLRRIEN